MGFYLFLSQLRKQMRSCPLSASRGLRPSLVCLVVMEHSVRIYMLGLMEQYNARWAERFGFG